MNRSQPTPPARKYKKTTEPHQHNHEEENEDGACVLDDERRRIYLFGTITEEKAANFLIAFQTLDATEGHIAIILNSPGGGVEAGYAIYDCIKLAQNEVTIEAFGKVASMAVLVLQAADHRLLSPKCEVMVHDVAADIEAVVNKTDAEDLAKDLKKSNVRYQKLVSQHTGIPLRKLARMCAKETFLGAEEAVELGFADGVMAKRSKE